MTLLRLLEIAVAVNALLLIVQSARVIAVYSAVYSLTEDQDRRQLPLHVWLIATSYLIYVCGTTYFILTSSVNFPLLRVTVYGVAGLIGQYALWNVLQYERRRYSAVTNFIDPEADDEGHGHP